MGVIANAFPHNHASRDTGHVDFNAVSQAALGSLDLVLTRILPGGYRDGHEYVSLNPTRGDGSPGSFKVNLQTGVWCDFATGDKGGDAIDLLAYVESKSKLEAARELGEMLNVSTADAPRSTSLVGNVRPIIERKPAASFVASLEESRTALANFPQRTMPNSEGKPRFVRAGDEGPRIRPDEKRRHVYSRGGVPVRIKIMRSGEADPFNVYRVQDANGETGWQYKKPEGFQPVPYWSGSDPFSVAANEAIYWPEGEKDADTLARAGLPAFTFGGVGDGLPSGCAEYVRGRAVVILSDNDEAGTKHAEAKAQALDGIASSVKIVHFADTKAGGDVSDWLASHSKDELIERIASTDERGKVVEIDHSHNADTQMSEKAPSTAPSSIHATEKGSLPHGYYFNERGLFHRDEDPDKLDLMLASPFDVVAETRDGDGGSWGLLLHWVDHDGREHRLAIPRASLAGDGSDARKILLDGGMYIAPNQKARQMFNAFLLQVRSPVRARATNRIGWHSDTYVLPDHCFGAKDGDTHLLQTATAHEHPFREAGTLMSWQENVAKYAVGNSRLILAISAAFAAPLVGPCSAESGGVHFRGASSTGKSTTLHVGGSVWGGGDVNGFIRSWRATANGLEGVALAHSDALLCLDELSQVPARDAGEAAYMLANGSGKSRSGRDGSVRRSAKWRVLFLSSGEISLADKMKEDGRGRRLAAGQEVRIVDIPADAGAGHGLFQNLHGFASADLFARHLRDAAFANYGVASRAYLSRIVPDVQEVRKLVSIFIKAFTEQYVPAGADGQVERVAQRFALIAAGGEVAANIGIVPWPAGTAVEGAGKCFDDWLAARGGIEPAEAREGIERVRAFLSANGMARFVPAWEESEQRNPTLYRDIAGYRRKVGDGWDFFIEPTAWKDEICSGMDARRLASTMREKGFIDSPPGPHVGKSVRVGDHGKKRLLHIPASFLADDENDEEAANAAA